MAKKGKGRRAWRLLRMAMLATKGGLVKRRLVAEVIQPKLTHSIKARTKERLLSPGLIDDDNINLRAQPKARLEDDNVNLRAQPNESIEEEDVNSKADQYISKVHRERLLQRQRYPSNSP